MPIQSAAFEFVVETLLPIYLIAALGYVLRRYGVLGVAFMRDSSRLVFNFAAPATLFISLASSTQSNTIAPYFLMVCLLLLMGLTLLGCLLAPLLVRDRYERGVFIQGATRGNLLVSGLAFTHSIYGMEGLALASLPLGIYIIFNNIFSVAILKYYAGSPAGTRQHYWRDILANPVIIAVLLGALCGALQVPIPQGAINTGSLLAQLTVPLILLNVGASLDFQLLRSPQITGWLASIYKCLVMPAGGVALAYAAGIEGMELGIIFLLLSSPTSTISVVFTQMFGGKVGLAANIVLISGLLSVVTVVGGLAVLQTTELIR